MVSLIISWISIVLLIAALIGILVAFFYGFAPYRRVVNAPSESDSNADSDGNEQVSSPESDEKKPAVTVVVCCQNPDYELDRILNDISRQNYHNFEIVVVCDGTAEYTEMLAEQFKSRYPNAYFTFVQPGSCNLSRRKLAITIGIKAARGEYVVITSSNVSIPSENWLAKITAPFSDTNANSQTDVVLGLSMLDFKELKGAWKWYRQFDDCLNDGRWIGYALCHHPYRGDGNNIALRKSVFFEHKGFSKTINLHTGEDDLFINEITNNSNCEVVIDADTILKLHWGPSANRIWTMTKEKYDFTSRWLPKAPFVRTNVLQAIQWIVPICLILAVCLNPLSLTLLIVSSLLLLIFWGVEIYIYRKLASRLDAVRLWWSVVPFWLWRPIGNLIFSMEHQKSKKKNFTWQR